MIISLEIYHTQISIKNNGKTRLLIKKMSTNNPSSNNKEVHGQGILYSINKLWNKLSYLPAPPMQ